MKFAQFEARAHEMFRSIPPQYREGVDGLEVSRAAVPHPTLPEVFTLGECKSEYYPSEFGGAGEVRSVVALYHGSFVELSRREEEWDWEGELWETITHEVQHHLESLASDDALEVRDYAEDQNFARREGEPFDPFFYRSGMRLERDVYEVDGDLFLERTVDPAEFAAAAELPVEWGGASYRVARPERLGDVHYLYLDGVAAGPGEMALVLVRRRSLLDWVRGLLSRAPLEVLSTEAEVEAGGPRD